MNPYQITYLIVFILIFRATYLFVSYLQPRFLTYTNTDKNKVEPCRTIVFINIVITLILTAIAYYYISKNTQLLQSMKSQEALNKDIETGEMSILPV
jgi:hypothetical protein